MKIRKGFVRYSPSLRCWIVHFSKARSKSGFWVCIRVAERYAKWGQAMNAYREHDRKVREYVQAQS